MPLDGILADTQFLLASRVQLAKDALGFAGINKHFLNRGKVAITAQRQFHALHRFDFVRFATSSTINLTDSFVYSYFQLRGI